MKKENKNKMATRQIFSAIILLAVVGHICASTTPQSAFKNVLEDVSSCKDSCERTYSVHTYPEVSLFVVLGGESEHGEEVKTSIQLRLSQTITLYGQTKLGSPI